MENPQPAFYAVIPATVRYNKNLEPNAKLLYGEITALANQYGYCWAHNEYFSELYQVEIRTVQNWIKALQKEKLIKVELDRTCFPPKRKIWVTPEIQKMFTSRKKFRHHHEKNFTHNNTSEYTKKKYIKRKSESSAAPITFCPQKRSFEGVLPEDIEQWKKAHPSVNVRKVIDEAAIWALQNQRKDYRKSLNSFMRNMEKKHTTPYEPPPTQKKEVEEKEIEKNKSFSHECERIFTNKRIPNYDLRATPDGILFLFPNSQSFKLDYQYEHSEFKKICEKHLKRLKINIK